MLLKYRKFVTSSVGFSFVVVGITGVIFKLFFKNHALEEIHGWLGLAMVVAAILHIVQNWKSIRNYLRDGRVLALLIPVAAVILFFALSPREERGRRINPGQIMRQLTQAPAADVARVFGKDINLIVNVMEKEGITVASPTQKIADIARDNQRQPDQVLAYFLR